MYSLVQAPQAPYLNMYDPLQECVPQFWPEELLPRGQQEGEDVPGSHRHLLNLRHGAGAADLPQHLPIQDDW